MDDLTKAMGNSRRAAVLQAARQRKEVLAAVVDARETAQWLLKARAIDVCVIDVSGTACNSYVRDRDWKGELRCCRPCCAALLRAAA